MCIKCKKLNFLPKGVQKAIHPFQIEGILFGIQNNGKCLIADEMGLGKTIQGFCVAYHFSSEWPLLIIVPSSLKYQWCDEIEHWFPSIEPNAIKVIQSGCDLNFEGALIVIVTYGLIQLKTNSALREAILNTNFKVILVDESHCMKNRGGQRAKFIMPLMRKAKRRILLSGTPALNKPEELFTQIKALRPDIFKSFTRFAHSFCDAQRKWFGFAQRWDYSGANNLDELHAILKDGILIRRLKNDVLKELPPKQRQCIPFDIKNSRISQGIAHLFKDFDAISNGDHFQVEKIMNGTWKNPSMSGLVELRSTITNLFQLTGIAKIGPVKAYLDLQWEDNELKMLVFCHHQKVLDALQNHCLERRKNFIRIDGAVPMAERKMLVDKFQKDPSVLVALLSIKASGLGITLTAAKLVVFAELYWSPGDLQQCEDRAHRIGQKDTVVVHYLVARGTLDNYIWSMVNRKTTMVSAALNGETVTGFSDDSPGGGEPVSAIKAILTDAEAFEEALDAPKPVDDALELLFCVDPEPSMEGKVKRMRFSPTVNKTDGGKRVVMDLDSPPPTNANASDRFTEITGGSSEGGSNDNEIGKYHGLNCLRQLVRSDLPGPSASRSASGEETLVDDEEDMVEDIIWSDAEEDTDCIVDSDNNESDGETEQFGLTTAKFLSGGRSETTTDSNFTGLKGKETAIFDGLSQSFLERELFGKTGGCKWVCYQCSYTNGPEEDLCANCLAEMPNFDECCDEFMASVSEEESAVCEDYSKFFFRCSQNSGRIYLYDNEKKPLNCNFTPFEIQFNSVMELPGLLKSKANFALVSDFVKKWNRLGITQQKMVQKEGLLFIDPTLVYEEIKARRAVTSNRFLTTKEINTNAQSRALEIGGSTRNLPRPGPETSTNPLQQVVHPDGTALCVQCMAKPTCEPPGRSQAPIAEKQWKSRFCSHSCADSYWMKRHGDYARRRLFELQFGVCQICHLNAHEFFQHVKGVADLKKRALLINSHAKYSQLTKSQKTKMTKAPREGQFWHVDHIESVWEGGGQCDLDNLRTLCTICHKEVTREQTRRRANVKKLERLIRR